MRIPPARLALLTVLVVLPVRAGASDLAVELKRGKDAPAQVREWFSSLDRLLSDAEALTSLLSREAAAPTGRTAARAADLAESMAGTYETLTRDGEGVKAVRRSAGEVRRLGGAGDQPLSSEAAEAVFSLDKESVDRWTQLMRQAALGALGPPGKVPANSLLALRGDGGAVEVPFLDVSDKPLAEDGRIVSPSLRGLCALLPGLGDKAGEASVVLAHRRLWLRRAGAEFFADFGTRESDGMLRVRYRETEGGALDQSAFYFFTKALYDVGLAVSVENGELVAVPAGERSALDPESRAERLAMAWKAFDTMLRLRSPAGRPYLAGYLEGSVSQDDNARRLDELARVFAAEGSLPFFDETRPGALRAGVEEYRRGEPARETLRSQMGAALSRLGLPPFPSEAGVGQRTIGLYYNEPLDAALARGELKRGPKGLSRDRSYDALALLAKAPRAKALAGRDLEPVVDQARTIGLVGPDLAQRAQWRVGADEWLTVYLLLDGGTGEVAGFEAQLCPLEGKPKPLSADKALALLDGIGVAAAQAPRPRAAGPAPGPFTARVTYDRAKAAQGDRIFVTPYVAHGDRDAARRSRALIATSAGPQSEILAARAGVPLLDLAQASWSESSGIVFDEPVFGQPRRLRSGRPAREVVRTSRRALREGDAVRFDPARMSIEFLPPARQEVLLRLEDALRAYDRGADIQAMVQWTVSQLTSPALSQEQKKDLGATLLDEMRQRRKGGAPEAHLERLRTVIHETPF